ncbi:MAG: FtsX-like permease family protein [Microthrixaceae bacterium]
MTTAERSGGIPPDPDHWDLPAPSGAPCADLPPPVAPTPTELAPEPQPALDHVPFDMDFIARTLARVIGEQTFTPPVTAPAPPAPSAPPAPPAPPPPPAYEPVAPAAPAADLLDADGRLFRFAPPKQQTGGETGGLRGIRVALRTLLRQRRRMLLSIVAVALGVGYLAGSLSLLQRVGAGLAAQAGAGTERADLVIEGTIADDGPLQQVRRLVPDTIVDQVRGIEGIAAVEPRLESKSTLILGPTGSPVVRLGLTERPLGANFPTEPSLNPYRFVGEGRAPATDTEVAIDAETAKVAKVKVGEPVLIAGKVGLKSFTVTGIVELTKGTFPAGSSLALFATEVARPLFELGPDDNAIAIKLEPGADRDEVIEQLRAIIFSGAEVSTGAEYAEHRQASFEKSFTLIRALLVGFAALALVVGAFTVANSMALLFDHRRRGFAMLRLMGASPSQLVGAATAEALLGGAIAGVVGLGLGLGVGAAIEWLIQSTGTPLPVAGPVITWWIPVLAVVIGAAVTVSTALSPARHASRTPPVHAVTGADDRPSDRSPLVTGLRWLATVVVVAAAAALLGSAFGGSRRDPPRRRRRSRCGHRPRDPAAAPERHRGRRHVAAVGQVGGPAAHEHTAFAPGPHPSRLHHSGVAPRRCGGHVVDRPVEQLPPVGRGAGLVRDHR